MSRIEMYNVARACISFMFMRMFTYIFDTLQIKFIR